ncbi:Putative transcription factor bHLH041 [Apostasia shenzhenica]|uniref:Transcription factor bHLH041 n=1 Tax=Apostasia shenzhenica TaxID=1088818 RepID=A0A2I0B767_9ASPA|nr:Putative transcription factor bHLH041 [Apostasia shenzhenica]
MVQGLLPSADHQQNWLPTSSASPQSNIMINTPAVPETLSPYSLFQHKLPSPQRDDLELARAMLAVISCTSSSSSSSPSSSSSSRPIYYQNITAFERYSGSNFSSAIFEGNSGLKGQRMLKKGISFLRKIYSLKLEEASFHRHEARPSSSQLHHVISERQRREKLSESFQALRMLLPPGSKKDKASVLSKTKDYLKSLKAQINDLEERNRRLEMQAQLKDKQVIKFDESTKDQRIDVQVIRESESTSKSQKINLRVIVRGAVKMIDLSLRILECLKGMGISNLVSVESNSISQQENIYIVTSLILQVQAGSWDDDSLKEAVNRAVQSLVTVEPDRR